MAKESVNIRLARDEDFKFFKKIDKASTELFSQYGCDISHIESAGEEYYREITGRHAIYVAHTDTNKLIGFCAVKIADANAYIAEISVLPEYSKQGIGTRLLEHAIYWAEINDFEYITLTTFKDIIFNAPFYKKFGFKEFIPDALWPEIKRIRKAEHDIGLEVMPRIAMRKYLVE